MPDREPILRWTAGQQPERVVDELAAEEPLEIRVNRQAISVTMRTPGHDRELAAGFLLSEGVIRDKADILGIEPCPAADSGNVIVAHVPPEVAARAASAERKVFLSSSCGLCGKASIASVRQQFPPIALSPDVPPLPVARLLDWPVMLRDAQASFSQTGGIHAAGLFGFSGDVLSIREDVGRHNAVDKVIGEALLAGRLPLNRHGLLVSGRASFEVAQKALSAGIPILAAVSAPSSLAVSFCREVGITLVGFLREGRMNVYTHPERLQFPAVSS